MSFFNRTVKNSGRDIIELTAWLIPFLVISTHSTTLAASETLDTVRERGVLRCGVNADLAGFSKSNSLGQFSGFDIDICRAVAISTMNTSSAVEFVPVSSAERFDALIADKFDVLVRNTTYTMQRNARYGEYAGISFFDGQGFLVRKSSGMRSAQELDNVSICVTEGTTSELNAADYFAISEMRYRPSIYNEQVDAFNAYEAGECDALTTDRSALAAQRTILEAPEAHVILPEIISKEPLGPVVRNDDAQWEKIVRWTLNCLINAEEMGLNKENIVDQTNIADPAIKRLLGTEGDLGVILGLNKSWCANIIAGVGNYGEIYNRHVGPDTAIGLERGVNSLWTNGGLLYAPPMR